MSSGFSGNSGYVHEFYQLRGNQHNQLFGYGYPYSGLNQGNAFAQMQASLTLSDQQKRAYARITQSQGAGPCKETTYGANISLNRKLEKAKEWMKSGKKQ